MDMERDGIDLDARPLRLARPVEIGRLQPLQLLQRVLHPLGIVAGQRIVDEPFDPRARRVEVQHRVEMRVVGPDRLLAIRIGAGMDHPHLGVVHPLLPMAIAQHLCRLGGFAHGHLSRAPWCCGTRGSFGRCELQISDIRPIDRSAPPTAAGKQTVFHQGIARSEVVVIGQARHTLAQQRYHRAVADGGAVFRGQGEDQVGKVGHAKAPRLRTGHGTLSREGSLCTSHLCLCHRRFVQLRIP
jgi:hypothetical protein